MVISVAMTTFNGEKYIEEQLNSLRLQTLAIDELIIQDDCSTDSTVKIINNYIKKWNLSNWKLFVNSNNKGWIKNFHDCISKTTGNIVFFCDQDDIWNLNKVEKMTNIMNENPNIAVLGCKLSMIDSNGKNLKDNKLTMPHYSKNTLKITKVNPSNKFLYAINPGCTMAVKRDFIDFLNIDSKNNIPHDALYWKIGILLGETYILDESLIFYRIHENNASHPISKSKIEIKPNQKRIKEAKSVLTLMNNLMTYIKNKNISGKIDMKLLENVYVFCKERINFLEHNNSIKILNYFFKNFKFYNNSRMFIGDILSRNEGEK